MNPPPPERILIRTSVRPARTLVLIPQSLDPWQDALMLLAEHAFQHWAGRWSFAAVPVDKDHRIPSPFLELARLFDPDYVVRFGPSLATIGDLGGKQDVIERVRRSLAGQGFHDKETLREVLSNEIATWPETEGPVGDQIGAHLPAFNVNQTFEAIDRIQPESAPSYPSTAWISYLETSPDRPPPIVRFASQTTSRELKLLSAWTLGRLSDGLQEWWTAHGGAVVEVPLFDDRTVRDSLKLIWGGAATARSFIDLEPELGTSLVGASLSYRGLLDCSVVVRRGASGFRPNTAIGVVGDSLEDFLLWLLLSRLRSNVYWVPTRFLSARWRRSLGQGLGSYATVLLSLIRQQASQSVRKRSLDLTSVSLSPQRLGQARRQLEAAEIRVTTLPSLLDESRQLLSTSKLLGEVQPQMLAIEREGYQAPTVIDLNHDGVSMAPLPSPPPRSSHDRSLGEKRWIVEYDLGKHLPPARHLGLTLLEAAGLSEHNVRVTTRGSIAVMFPHIMTMAGATIDDTWRIRLRRLPSGVDLLDRLFGHDYSVRLMDKGRYFLDLQDRLPVDELSALIDDDGVERLLSILLGKDDSHSSVDVLGKRHLDINAARAIAGDHIERMLEVGLIYLVHAVKCQRCRHTEMRRLPELAREMICQRCDRAVSLEELSSDPFFRTQRLSLNGVLDEFLGHRGDAVVSAFASLAAEIEGLELLPEIEVVSSDATFNIDLVAVGHGHVYLGEVKTGRRYMSQREMREYRQRMDRLSALIAPVPLTVVHGWTKDLSDKEHLLRSRSYSTKLIRLPIRKWYD